MNKIILGTVQMGLDYGIHNKHGKPNLSESFDILNTAFDKGIRILDTAEAYGNSQEVIGEFHKKFPNKIFNIISKLSANHSVKKEQLLNHIKGNCKKLHCKQLLCYMFHSYQSFKENIHFYNEFVNAKKTGLIKEIGISLYKNEEINDIVNNYNEFDIIQIPFNLFDNASKRKNYIEKAREKGIQVHTRSVFLQGLFFYELDILPQKLHPLRPYLLSLESIKKANHVNIQTLAMQYVLQKEYINYMLIGVETKSQLLKNIESSQNIIDIPHKDIDSINVEEEFLLNPSNWNS